MIATIYDLKTGLILNEISGSAAVVLANVDAGKAYIEGSWPAHRYRIVNGQPVEYVPDKPDLTETRDYDWDAEQWRWVPVLTVAGHWQEVRRERNRRIAATDWTQDRDIPEAVSQKWQSYRQALRDVTKQSDPTKIEWPKEPN